MAAIVRTILDEICDAVAVASVTNATSNTSSPIPAHIQSHLPYSPTSCLQPHITPSQFPQTLSQSSFPPPTAPELSQLSPTSPHHNASLQSQLQQANATVDLLRVSRDAMSSTITSLKVLVENERAVTRATKRQLVTAQSTPNDQLQTLREKLSTAEHNLLQARQSDQTLHDQTAILRLKISEMEACHKLLISQRDDAAEEKRVASVKVTDLLAQLQHTETINQDLALSLSDQHAKTHRLSADNTSLEQKIQSLSTVATQRDQLSQTLVQLQDDLKSSRGDITNLENQLSLTILDKDAQIDNLTFCLEEKSELVERLRFELDCPEPDSQRHSKTPASNRSSHASKHTSSSRSDQSHPLSKLRSQLSAAEQSEKDALSRAKISEGLVASLKHELEQTRSELKISSENMSTSEQKHADVQEKLSCLEQQHSDTQEKLSSALSKLASMEESRKADQELRQHVDEYKRMCKVVKDTAQAEVDRMQELLKSAQEEVLRLHNNKRPVQKGVVDDIGSTSPCSIDGSSGGNVTISKSEFVHLDSLADLEAAANISHVSAEETQSDSPTYSIIGLQQSEIANPNPERVLQQQASSPTLKTPDETISSSSDVESLRETLNVMERDLASKEQECKELETQIEEKLAPSLDAANVKLGENINAYEKLQAEYSEFKRCADETQQELERNLKHTSSRMNNTITMLESTQQRLHRSEEQIRNYETTIEALTLEKKERLQTINELSDECEHRRLSLVVLRKKLVEVESIYSAREQILEDTESERSSLQSLLREQQDRLRAADHRTGEQNVVLRDMEQENRGLLKEKAEITLKLMESTRRISELEQEVGDLDEALEINKSAMLDHAREAGIRDEAHLRLSEELKAKLGEQDNALGCQTRALERAEERVKNISKALDSASTRLGASEERVGELNAEVERKEAGIRKLEETIGKLRASGDASSCEVGEQSKLLEALHADVERKAKRIESLQVECRDVEKTVRGLKEEIATGVSHQEACEVLLSKMQKDLAEVRGEVHSSEVELRERTLEAEALSMSLGEAQEALNRCEEMVTEKENETAMKQKEVDELKGTLCIVEKKLDGLQARASGHETLVEEVKVKEEMVAAKMVELSRASVEMTSVNERMKEYELKLDEQQKVLRELETELEKVRVEKTGYEREVESLKERTRTEGCDLKEKEAVIVKLSEKVEKYEEKGSKEERRIEELVGKEGMLMGKLGETEEKLKELQGELDMRQEKVRRLEGQVGKLEEKQKGKSGEVAEAVARGESKDKVIERLHEWCSFINKKLRAAEKECLQRETDVEVCTEAMKRLETRMEELHGRMRKKESELRQTRCGHGVEVAQLKSRVESLRKMVNEERVGEEGDEGDRHKVQAQLRMREMDLWEARAKNEVLADSVRVYEREMEQLQRRVDGCEVDSKVGVGVPLSPGSKSFASASSASGRTV